MLDRLRRMFSKSRSGLSDEAREFITKLATSDIWILAVGLRGTPVIPSITDPAAFDIIAAHRINVSESFSFERPSATSEITPLPNRTRTMVPINSPNIGDSVRFPLDCRSRVGRGVSREKPCS